MGNATQITKTERGIQAGRECKTGDLWTHIRILSFKDPVHGFLLPKPQRRQMLNPNLTRCSGKDMYLKIKGV